MLHELTITVDDTYPGVLSLLRDLAGLKLVRLAGPASTAASGTDPDWFENGGDCPLCAVYKEPNEETIAAFAEGDAMERGEIPANRFHSFEEMWEALHK